MQKLTIDQVSVIEGGDFVGAACVGIGAGSVVYAAGAMTNFWNPVGWASAAFLIADAACVAYAASTLE